jgi:hypothetical protein
MSKRSLQQLGTSMEELTALGGAYYPTFFNPDEAHEYVPKLVELRSLLSNYRSMLGPLI